jgi:hypothetical protein
MRNFQSRSRNQFLTDRTGFRHVTYIREFDPFVRKTWAISIQTWEKLAHSLNMCLLKWCYRPGQVSIKSALFAGVNLRHSAVSVATGTNFFAFSTIRSTVLKASPRQSHWTNPLQTPNCI